MKLNQKSIQQLFLQITTNKIFRFGIVGVLNTLAYVAIYYVISRILKLDVISSSIVAFTICVLSSYLLNYYWTFRSSQNHGSSLPRYAATYSLGFFLNIGIMYVTVQMLKLSDWIGLTLVILVVPFCNFMLSYFWAFNHRQGLDQKSK